MLYRRLSEAEHEHSLELNQLKMKHLDIVRELEEGREVCVTECKALEAQLEAQGRSIEARDSMLADKVPIDYTVPLRSPPPPRSVSVKVGWQLPGRGNGRNKCY